MNKYNSNIILIGAMGVGKTSVAKIVAKKLNKNHIDLVRKSLEPYKNVIFLRYSSDEQESLDILDNRHTEIPNEAKPFYRRLNEHIIKNKCNEMFAKYIIETKGLTIEEISEKVISYSVN